MFKGVCKDAQTWLAQANQLKMSADVIEIELKGTIARFRFDRELNDQLLAFLKSFMLLVGMAFENLIKGILVGRDPTNISREEIKKQLLGRGGHGISEGAKTVTNISNAEYDLLRRLEEYLIWAGRYPMPLKSKAFYDSQTPENLRSFGWTDFKLIDSLYDRLAEILDNEWSVRTKSKCS